jgi:hypothetical protein
MAQNPTRLQAQITPDALGIVKRAAESITCRQQTALSDEKI